MNNKEKVSTYSDLLVKVSSSDINEPNKNNPGLLFLLKELADDDNFFVICHALFHLESEISIGASLVLGHMKDKRALPYLLRALLTTDHKRAEAIMWALGEIGDESSIPFLLSALNAGFVVKSALLALGKIGSPIITQAILNSLSNSDEAVRILAAKALSQIRFERKSGMILKVIQNLKLQLKQENSRRVKLLVAVMCSRLEKLFCK